MKYKECPLCGLTFCKPVEFTKEEISVAEKIQREIDESGEMLPCPLCTEDWERLLKLRNSEWRIA